MKILFFLNRSSFRITTIQNKKANLKSPKASLVEEIKNEYPHNYCINHDNAVELSALAGFG